MKQGVLRRAHSSQVRHAWHISAATLVPPGSPLWLKAAPFILAALLSGCGGGSSEEELTPAHATVMGTQPGVTPFISLVQLHGLDLPDVTAVHYSIEPKPGSVSKPVAVTYSIDSLQRRGYATAASESLTVPVFGLYAGFTNRVTVELQFEDGSTVSLPVLISTAAYVDPNGIYDQPTILKGRVAGSELGFDFFAMKSSLGTPVVVDTDAAIRWVGVGIDKSLSSAYQDNGFVVGDQTSTTFWRVELDGSIAEALLDSSGYTNFHHNIDPGKSGLLAEFDATTGGVKNVESNIAEITSTGTIVKTWDFAAMLSAYMQSQGDDPTAFVRPGADWFHNNAATYDPSDDSLIVSSRENFVIKVDYSTGNVIWILGDPTKYWYTFPSLRAKALNLQPGGLYPIGQHATSITSDGLLMLFNDGAASFNMPPGAPAGDSRTYSAVSAYSIDANTLTAQEVWRFDYGQSIYSDICSGAYEAAGKSVLVDYAAAVNRTQARLVGLDSNHNVVFDFQYASPGPCVTSFNAVPVPFEGMTFN